MKLHVVDWRVTLKNILLTVAGTMILAFGTAVFILPFELVSGGVSGTSFVVQDVRNADAVMRSARMREVILIFFIAVRIRIRKRERSR